MFSAVTMEADGTITNEVIVFVCILKFFQVIIASHWWSKFSGVLKFQCVCLAI